MWQQFFKQYCVNPKFYRDLDKLVTDLKQHTIAAAFIPAGAYYYLRDDPYYQGIASATLGAEKVMEETSYLIVRKKDAVTQVSQLKDKKWGYINRECTTSFFAPQIYLASQHLSANYFKKLIPLKGFDGQVQAMNQSTKDSNIDVTMLWSVYWLKDRSLQNNTLVIGTLANLPTPVMILTTENSENFKTAFVQQLLDYQSSKGATWIYSGFAPYQAVANQKFWNHIEMLEF